MLDFESTILTPARREHDPELGFLPLLAAAIPMVTSLAGSLLSKKSKKGGGPPPEAAQAQSIADILSKAIGQDAGKGEVSIKDVVRNIVSTVPSPVIGQVKAALQELKLAKEAGDNKRAVLVNAVDNKLGPHVGAILAAAKAASLQRQATYEHNKLKAKTKFRKDVTGSLHRISKRLNHIENRLNRAAIVQGQSRIDILGGRNLLER
jgi:hypothetical protein